MIWTGSITVFGRKLLFHFQSMKVPKTKTKGLSSRKPNSTFFTVFMDYDNIVDWRLDEELRSLQELFELGDFYVFKTNEYGRHAICVDLLIPKEVLEVIEASTCDWLFQRGIRINEYRTWILRYDKKGERPSPTFMRAIESQYNGKRVQSQAHAMFLEAWYGVKVRLVNPDGNEELEIQEYKTSSKVTVKDLLKELKKGTK